MVDRYKLAIFSYENVTVKKGAIFFLLLQGCNKLTFHTFLIKIITFKSSL